MGGSDNPFIARMTVGTIASEADLRRCYRRLALRTHPDTAPEAGGEAFRRLKAAYDEALAHLRARVPTPDVRPGRREFYRNFCDLMAASLPSLFTPLAGRPEQLRRRSGLGAAHDRLRPERSGAMDRVVSEMNALESHGPKGKRLAGELRGLLFAIASWHYYPSPFARQGIERDASRLGPSLLAAGCPETVAFVDWLAADLRRGAALE